MARFARPSANGRIPQLAIVATFLISIAWFLTPPFSLQHINVPGIASSRPKTGVPAKPRPDHPIATLLRRGDSDLKALLAKETTNLHDAAQAYRDRRGRQPPPGFDRWHKFAQEQEAIMIEDFFDPIYENLNPFWGVPAKQMREQAHDFYHRISVRNGVVSQREDIEPFIWLDLWQDLLETIAQHLPDVDLAINNMDESRMVVQWEEINEYVKKERANRRILPQEELKDTFQSLAELDQNPPPKFDPGFDTSFPYWPKAVIGCPPWSEARKAEVESDFTLPPPLNTTYPKGSYYGYVQNWTLATSPCDHGHIQGLHGTFVHPLSLSNTKTFFPLFGGSKLPMNNEILLPAAMYWTEDPFYSGGEAHGDLWRAKADKMIWRGAASGGRNMKDNWTRFQRHRFVAMVNGTSVELAEKHPETPPPNFVLPTGDSYSLASKSPGSQGGLGAWIKSWSNVGFVNLLCTPPVPDKGITCPYTDPYFMPIWPRLPMSEFYDYKYLPDIDGNSFSGRYRGYLGSTSMPIKATIYQEWHDSRLVPWKHFVPMDNTFIDIYGIMEFFLGNEEAGLEGHDGVAQEIALAGKEWSEKVLRKKDMQIYVFRLLLEYARLCDDDREIMGWREGPDMSGHDF